MPEAIALARRLLELRENIPAQGWRVERLDRPGEAYHLVIFGGKRRSIAVAAVDASSGELLSHARLPGERSQLEIDERKAVRLAGLGDAVAGKLVWKPCAASFSMFYPLWQITGSSCTVYVDQQGCRWDELTAADPGD